MVIGSAYEYFSNSRMIKVRVHQPRHAGGSARLLGRARLKPRRTSSRSFTLVTTYTVIARYRSFVVYVCTWICVCMRAGSFIHVAVFARTCTCTGAALTRTHARRRRFAWSSPSTTTTRTVKPDDGDDGCE